MTVRQALVGALLVCSACGGSSSPPGSSGALQIVTRRPAIGEPSAWSREPIRLTFSKPLDPASVADGALTVSQATGTVPVSLSLSADGLTVTAAARDALAPGWVLVEPSAKLRDRAGNAFSPDATVWAYVVSAWAQPGGAGPISSAVGPLPRASLVLDADDEPIVGMAGLFPFAARFSGGAWAEVPEASPRLFPQQLASSGGDLFLASLTAATIPAVQVSRWTGAKWEPLGGPMEMAAFQEVALAARAAGPVVLIREDGSATRVHVRAWNGATWASWADLDGVVAGSPHLAVGRSGAVCASYRGASLVVARVGPVGLDPLPGGLADGTLLGDAALAVDAAGDPVVAFWDLSSAGTTALRVKRWTGVAWAAVGDAVASVGGGVLVDPALAIAADGAPVVAWAAGDPAQLGVARWTGTAWERLADSLNADPGRSVGRPALALDAHDAPVVAWPEGTGQPAAGVPSLEASAPFLKRFSR